MFCAACLAEVLRRGGRLDSQCPLCRRFANGRRMPDVQEHGAFRIFCGAFTELVGPPSRELYGQIHTLLHPRSERRGAKWIEEWCEEALVVAHAVQREATAQRRDAPAWLRKTLSQIYTPVRPLGEAPLLANGILHRQHSEVAYKLRRPDLAALVNLQIRLTEEFLGRRTIFSVHDDFEEAVTAALEDLRPFVGMACGPESLTHLYNHCSWDVKVCTIIHELFTGWDL